MDCGRVSDQLGFYIDGTLDGRSIEGIERHLAACAECRAELASLRMLIGAAREIEAEEPPLGLRSRIAAETTHSRNARVQPGILLRLRGAMTPRAFAWAGGLACVVAAIGVTIVYDQPGKPAHQVAIKTLSPAPVVTDTQKVPSGPILAAVSPTAAKPPSDVAAVEPARRHRSARKSFDAAHTVATAPRAGAVEGSKPAGDEKDVASPDHVVDEVAEIDDTTSAATVAYKQVAPAPETASTSAGKQRPVLDRIASSPALDKSQTEQWLKEMKTNAAMRGRDHRGSSVVSVISARF